MVDKELIKKLKENERPLGLLDKEMVEGLKDAFAQGANIQCVGAASGWAHSRKPSWCYSATYRINPEWEPEPERWLLSKFNELVKASPSSDVNYDMWTEVPPEALQYVRACLERDDIGEFEYRMNVDDVGVLVNVAGEPQLLEERVSTGRLRFVRKAKAGRWVEYPVYKEGGRFLCVVTHDAELPTDTFCLNALPSIVGFGGVRFEEDSTPDAFYDQTTAGVMSGGKVTLRMEHAEKPATPIKARFWAED